MAKYTESNLQQTISYPIVDLSLTKLMRGEIRV